MAKTRSSSSAPGDAGGNAIVPIERNEELAGIGSPWLWQRKSHDAAQCNGAW